MILRTLGTRDLQITKSGALPKTEDATAEVQYIIVDGQQRLDSISLGVFGVDQIPHARLWLDLAEPANRDKRFYDFYLCTRDNPWGSDVSQDGQRNALKQIGSEEFDLNSPLPDQTWPIRAKCPVPFVELCQLLKRYPSGIYPPDEEISILIPPSKRGASCRTDLDTVFDIIRSRVLNGEYKIPFIIAENLDKKKLGSIFERLNTQGVTPGPAELFFSALKLRWPPANNLVSEIYEDHKTGKFLSPTEITHLAVRIVSPSTLELNLDRFDRLVNEHENQLKTLLNYTRDEPISPIHRYLLWARKALEYNQLPGDLGFPPPLIMRLRPRIWHTIVYWIAHHPEGVTELNRLEMLRYAMFDMLYLDPKDRGPFMMNASFGSLDREPRFNLIDSRVFPGVLIYQMYKGLMEDRNKPFKILTPDKYYQEMKPELTTPTWFQLHFEVDCLLVWAQREYFNRWFGKHNQEIYWKMT